MGKSHIAAGHKINGRDGTGPGGEPPRVAGGRPFAGPSLGGFRAKSSTGLVDLSDDFQSHRLSRRHQPRRQHPVMKPRKIRQSHTPHDFSLEEKPPLEGSIDLQLCARSPEKDGYLEKCSHSQTNGSCRGMTGAGMLHNGNYCSVLSHSLLKEKNATSISEEGSPIDEASCAANKAFFEGCTCSSCGYICSDEKGIPSEDCCSRNTLSKRETERVSSHPTKGNQGLVNTSELMLAPVVPPTEGYCDTEAVSTLLHKEHDRQQQNEDGKENQEQHRVRRERISSGDHLSGLSVKVGQVSKGPHFSGSLLVESQTSLLTMCAPTSIGKEDREEEDAISFWGAQRQQQHAGTPAVRQNSNAMYEFTGSSISSIPGPPTGHQQHHRSYGFTPEVSPSLCQLVDEHVVSSLSQTAEKMMRQRQKQLRGVAEYLTEAITHEGWSKGVHYGELRYYVFGSVAMCTVLPDSDNDMTIDVERILNPTKILEQEEAPVNSHARPIMSRGSAIHHTTNNNNYNSSDMSSSQAAAIAGGELLSNVAEYLREHNTHVYVDALVVAEVRVLKLVMEGSCFDITVGQLGGVECVRFLQEMDTLIGCQHLLKRTLLLLKAWCCYEAHILSGQGGYLSSYAATIMLIAMMNTVEFLEDVDLVKEKDEDGERHLGLDPKESFKNISPLQLFARFLKFFSFFDFEHYCVTMFGPLPCACLDGNSFDLTQLEGLAREGGGCGAISRPGRLATEDGDFEDPMGVNLLGLTAEGQRELGHCIRRRAKPLITVHGVKQIVKDEHIRRQCDQKNPAGLHRDNGGVEPAPNSVESAPEGAEQPHPNSGRGIPGDASFLCWNFDTSHFPVRTMNVMDPLRWSASLCRGVSRNHLQRIRRAFREGLALFEKGSTILCDTALSSFAANSEYSDASLERSSGVYECSGVVSDLVKVVRVQRHCLDAVNSVLKDLFGHTLAMLRRHNVDCLPSSVTPRHVQCKQCLRPSFFCASYLTEMCELPLLVDLQDPAQKSGDEHDGGCSNARETISETNVSSLAPAVLSQRHSHPHHHHQQHQQQQQQLNMLKNSLCVVPAPGPTLSTVSSNTQTDSLRFANSICGVNWHGLNKHLNRDSSMNLMSMPQHPARGAPLLRYRVKDTSVPRCQPMSSAGATTNGNLFSAESASFNCYPDFPTSGSLGTNCRTSIERNTLDGAPMGFAPLPLPLPLPPPPPPAMLVSSLPPTDAYFETTTASQNAQNVSRMCAAAPSHVDGLYGGLYQFNSASLGPPNLVLTKANNVRL